MVFNISKHLWGRQSVIGYIHRTGEDMRQGFCNLRPIKTEGECLKRIKETK
jgi:hypothetical protein